MKKYFSYLIIFIITSLFTNSCSLFEKNIPTYHFDPIFREYVIFPIGSYWVYKEINLVKTDSLYLDNQTIYVTDKLYKYKSEFARQALNSSYDQIGFVGWCYATDTTSSSISYYKEQSRISQTGIDKVFFKGKIGEVFELGGPTITKYEALYDTLSVNKVVYNQVRVYTILKQSFDKQTKRVYYAKNVGVIKKELFNGEVWELKKYFINK